LVRGEDTMIQRITKVMEPHIKQRFNFAVSAFVRMWGHKCLNDQRIMEFCVEWAHLEVNAPLSGLDQADQYFYYEYKNWRGI
jgi:hypothetical protein